MERAVSSKPTHGVPNNKGTAGSWYAPEGRLEYAEKKAAASPPS
jgi:hypothetical protein